MPVYRHVETLNVAPEELFALFLRPAQALALVARPDLELVGAPEVLSAGAIVTLRTRKYGLSQKVSQRVEAIDPPQRLVLVQERGPLRAYRLEQMLEAVETGTRLTEVTEFEPPGGILGRLLTESVLLAEFADMVERRTAAFRNHGW